MLSQISYRSISCTPKLRSRLIKFRHGVRTAQAGTQEHRSTAGDQQTQLGQPQSGEPIWDFQIPARWRRKPLDEEEIAVINNGGPLK